jgi:hypothetical protein
LLVLAVLLAPPLDNSEEFGVLGQKRYQIVTLSTLYSSTIVVEGAKDQGNACTMTLVLKNSQRRSGPLPMLLFTVS